MRGCSPAENRRKKAGRAEQRRHHCCQRAGCCRCRCRESSPEDAAESEQVDDSLGERLGGQRDNGGGEGEKDGRARLGAAHKEWHTAAMLQLHSEREECGKRRKGLLEARKHIVVPRRGWKAHESSARRTSQRGAKAGSDRRGGKGEAAPPTGLLCRAAAHPDGSRRALGEGRTEKTWKARR